MTKENELTPSKMVQFLDWSYEKALNGLPKTQSTQELAESYLSKHNTIDDAIDALIAWQNTKAGTSGFLTGLGGAFTLPIAIPANLASVLYVQLRMVAAIAYMRGYDIKDDQVKTLAFIALTGQAAGDILKEFGIKTSTSFLKVAIRKVPGEVIKKINQRVGFRLMTKFGSKGIINLGKLVPVAGGVIGATVDVIGTNTIGKVAKDKLFINPPPPSPDVVTLV
ncbi:EcsC family protein [Priestia sp. SIMBA_032]|uniref:EcsC family protein n=1 Tax=Priestia sp. SIMBA_032 TaxID=3085775 RepID=UPI00397D1758